MRTRKTSPMIHSGSVVSELSMTKNAPTHCESLICSSVKSVEEIAHSRVLSPNLSDTLTVVEHAGNK